MKTFAVVFPSLLALAAACGGKTPEAQPPENGEESSSSGSGAENPPEAATQRGAVRNHDKDGPTKCGGFEVADLIAVLSQAACEVPGANPDAAPRDVKDVLEISVKPESARAVPGSKSNVVVVFHNKGKADLPLDFVVDPEPRFDFELYTLKGSRADRPRGEEPPLPPGADGPAPDKKIARVTLAPEGTATATLSWDAVKYKWASKERAKGALPGRGYPREPAGPLPKGKYVLRVVTPLVGVFEGVDHEVSQPRVQIEIANL